MEYKVGDLFFWNGDGFYSNAIRIYNKRKFKQSDVTHIGIISKVEKDKVLIHEAVNKGFISSWYNIKWLNESDKVRIGRVNQKMNNVFENCEKYKDIGYGWLDIFGLVLSGLFGYKLLGITGKNKLICSEAVSRIVYDSTKSVNFAKEYNIVYDGVTPQHIFLSKFVKIIK